MWSYILCSKLETETWDVCPIAFANALRLNETAGTLTLAMMNFGRVPGQVLIGHISDTVGPRRIILGMAIISSVSVYLIWGFAASEPVLLVFSLVFGAFAGR